MSYSMSLIMSLFMTSLITIHGNIKPSNTAFNLALKWVLLYEGECSNDYGDRGGLTCYGITHADYAEYLASKGLPQQSVTQMPVSQAEDIYYTKYWLGSGADRLTFRLSIAVFDWQVNHGSGVIDLQTIVGAKRTNYVNTDTLLAISQWEVLHGGEDALLRTYFDKRESEYRLYARHGQQQFLSDWLWRSLDLRHKLGVE